MPKMVNKIGTGRKLFNVVSAVLKGTRPKEYECRFMQSGLTNYPGEDGKGQEMWYLPRSIMNEMQKGFIGCPVVTEDKHESESNPENFRLIDPDGVITNVYTDPDGWDHAKFIVWDGDTQKKIEKDGYNVSCAYNTIESAPGGILNAIPYDHEVKKAEYIHMAIVPAPRQTGAKILLNSIDIPNDGGIIFSSLWNGEMTDMKLYPKGRTMANGTSAQTKAIEQLKRSLGASNTTIKEDHGEYLLVDLIVDGKTAEFEIYADGQTKQTGKGTWVNSSKKNAEDFESVRKDVLDLIGQDIVGRELLDKLKAKGYDDRKMAYAEQYWKQVYRGTNKNEGGQNMEKCNKFGKLMSECNCEKKNEAPTEIDPEKALIETPDGDVPLTDMVNAYNAAKKNEETPEEKKAREEAEAKKNEETPEEKKAREEAEAKKNEFPPKKEGEEKPAGEGDEKKLTLEDEFEGVKVSDMYNAYKAKKNSDEEEAKKKAEAEAKEKENFNTLKNAADKPAADDQPEQIVMPRSARIKAAKSSGQY